LKRADNSGLWGAVTFTREPRLVRILFGIMTVGGISAVAKFVFIIKGAVIGRQFGVSDDLDAFYMAFLLPSFISELFAGATVVTFTPLYVRIWENDGRGAAQKFFALITTRATLMLTAGSILLWAISPRLLPLFAGSFNPAKVSLIRALFPYLLLSIPLSVISAIFVAVMTAKDRLALATMPAVINGVIVTLSVYAFAERWGIYAVVAGMAAGLVGQVVALVVGLKCLDLWPALRWYGRTPQAASFLKQFMILVAGSSVINLVDVADQYSAAAIGPGSVSALNYGNKLAPLVVGLAGVALTTSVLPHFSTLVATGDRSAVKHILKVYSILILLVTVPATLLLIYFSPAIVSVLFEGRAFLSQDTLRVAAIQRLFLLQLPLHVLGLLFVSLLWAMRANWVFLVINPACLLVKVCLNNVLISQYGVAGIGLATTITYSISCVLLLLAVARLMKNERANADQGVARIAAPAG
jgi:putative peptidoglycan lipid II flippase